MENEIIHKISMQLRNLPLNEEASVVYLLTAIRKIFEWSPNLGTVLPTLEFYCNWALHVKLDRAPAQKFLEAVYPILTLQGNHDQKTQETLHHLLTLGTFRGELKVFLERNAINTELCVNSGYWKNFLIMYSRVVENCELAMRANLAPPGGPLNLAVESLSIRPSTKTIEFNEELPYPMEWIVAYRDGRKGRLLLSEQGLLGAHVIIDPISA